MSFTRPVRIRFDEGDPRGILFYGRLHELSHRVFEEFVQAELVARWEDWFLTEDFVVPIKRAEATYNRPLRPGQEYNAELTVATLGESSFEILTRFYEPGDHTAVCAETRVLHVFADPIRFRKMPIPSALRARLEAHLSRE